MVTVPRVGARIEELQHANLHPRLVVVGGLVLHDLRSHAVMCGEQAVSTGRSPYPKDGALTCHA